MNFSICNDIIFNPVKSVCVVFQPKKSKLFCPNVTLDNNGYHNTFDYNHFIYSDYLSCTVTASAHIIR